MEPIKTTFNHDIVWLNSKINRFIIEAMKAAGANTSGINQFTLARLRSYMADLRSKVTTIQGIPELDLPESTPRLYDLDEAPVILKMENDDLAYICRLLELGREELNHSQSGRIGARLKSFDADRFLAIVGKCEVALDAIEADPELDLPESSPRDEMTGEGRKGI